MENIIIKHVENDEISMEAKFLDGHLNNLKFSISDEDIFPRLSLDKKAMAAVTDAIFNAVKQIMQNIKPSRIPLPKDIDHDKIKEIENQYQCPRHGKRMHIEIGCCGNNPKMRCEICGYSIPLPFDFLKRLDISERDA
ncbi:MAG: hypothetical protein JRI44_00240 [Deltaproteobacteria bacterium]|nr:hypothetical protein [Deltaproteobacteria bacterium]